MSNLRTQYFFSFDSLTIYDGGSSTSPMMGQYCGNSIPPSQVSSSNEALIQFQSDGILTYPGFKMEYNPTSKQNTSIQNNIIQVDRCRILVTSSFPGVFIIYFRKVIKIFYQGTFDDYVDKKRLEGGQKCLFLSKFRVKNVYVEVGGGQKRAKLCPRSQ